MPLSQHEAITRFLRHKDFQAHLIGQFIHRSLYEKNPIPPMLCYEDFAVFPGMLMQSSKIAYQRQGHYYYIKRRDSLSSSLDASKISTLVECTLQMERTFPSRYKHLVNCHWFDIYSNHRSCLTDQQLQLVKQRVKTMYTLSFSCPPMFVLATKKGLLRRYGKIKPRLYQLTIALSLISLILALVSSGKQREFFYIAIYVSIIGLAFEYKKITLRPFTIALPILLIGLLNLGWYLLYEYHNEGLNLYSDYLGASKKLILASVLIFYIDRFKFYIDKDTFRKFFFFATALGFVLATGYGLWQASQGMTRVEMAINRATVSAYVYSVLSLAFVYSLYLQQNVKLYVVAGFTILISYFVILLTGTRAAMGLYLLLAIVLTLYHSERFILNQPSSFYALLQAL